MPQPEKFDVTRLSVFVIAELMKTLFLFVVLSSTSVLFSQKKLKTEELSRYDWVLYNQHVEDSLSVFDSDTLLLAKSHDCILFEAVQDENGENVASAYPGCWQLGLSEISDEPDEERMEFSIHYVDLRKAAIRRSLELDSMTFYLLRENLQTVALDSTLKIYPVLNTLANGDAIQVTNLSDKKSFYIKRSGGQFIVLTTIRQRFIYFPKGLNEGFWSFSKKDQLFTFYNTAAEIGYRYRAERIDDIRIRLVRTTIELR